MSTIERSGLRFALVVLALVPVASNAAFTQAPVLTPASAQAIGQASTQPEPASPASASTSAAQSAAATAVATAFQPTPEQLGDSLAGHQRYQAAIEAYSKEPNPTADVWNKLGIAYQMMFNLKDATRCYNVSLKLDSRNATVLNNLATVYDSLKEYGTAERYYRRALKIEPRSALILRNFGSNQLTQHRLKKGWEAYQTALAIDPGIFQNHSGASVENPASTQQRGAMHYYMAKGCVSTGNQECAIQNLRMAINEGYVNARKVATDSAFASLYDLPAFQQMIAAQTTSQ
jgi:tetratricopeptide (TPR) repeat protein